MTIEVITGAPKRGLYGDIASRVRACVNGGGEVVWLTPNYHTAKRVSREIREVLPYGVATTTLGAYLETLWGLFGTGKRLVDNVAREVFIAQVFDRHVWRHLSHPPVSTNGIKEALHTLCPAVQDPRTLRARTEVEKEIRELLVEYFAILETTEFLEKRQALAQLDLPLEHAPLIILDGFTTLSSFDFALIERLGRQATVVCLFEWRADLPQTSVSTQSIQKLENMGASHLKREVAPPCGEIEAIAEALWRDLGGVSAEGQVSLAEAAGEGLEPILALGQIRRLLDDGYDPSEIAVVHPRLGTVYKKFSEVAKQREIPLEVDIALPFKDTSFGKAFIALVNTAGDTGSRTTALTFLRSPYSGVPSEEAYKVDEYWRQERIDDPQKIRSSLLRVPGELPFMIKEAQSARRGVVDARWAKHWEHVGSRFLSNAKAHRVQWGDGQREIDPFDAAAHTALIDALGAAAAIGEALSSEQFFDALKRTRVATGDKEGAKAVLLTEPGRIVGREFPVVMIAGLSAHEFPAGGDETFTSALMSSLSLAESEQRGAAQRNLFYSLVSSARERLMLSRTSMGLDGAAISPSPFYEDVKTLYQKPFEYESDEAVAALPKLETLGFAHLEEVAGKYSSERVALRSAVLKGERAILRSPRGTAHIPGLSSEYDTKPFSASVIEDYLACPYRWFYARILRANEIDSQFDNAERGSVAHAILETFYRRVIAEVPEGRATPGNLSHMHELLDEVFAQAQEDRGGDGRSPEEWMGFESLRGQLHGLIGEDAKLPGSLKPAEVEWDFGRSSEEASEPLEIEGISVRGTVDRIDVGEQGAVLFDYKSGRGFSATVMVNERRVQAVLYARAVEKEFRLPVAASLYRSIRSGEATGLELKGVFPDKGKIMKTPNTQEVWEKTFDEIMGMAHRAVSGISSGQIEPEPNGKDTTVCAYCDAHLICERARA